MATLLKPDGAVFMRMDIAGFLERMRTMRKNFIDNQPDFENLDNYFADPFATDLLALIEEAEAFESDENALNLQQQLKADADAQWLKAEEQVNDLLYYVKKLTKEDKRFMAEFGFSRAEYQRRYHSHTYMTMWMRTTHSVALDYETELLALDMPPALPAQFMAECNALFTADLAHEKQKRIRLRLTRQRIALLNNIYTHYYQRIHSASLSIWPHGDLKRAYFGM